MMTILTALLISAQPSRAPVLDGLERAVVVAQAREYAFERRLMPDEGRRVYVESRLRWNARPLAGRDEDWIGPIASWACKPYDHPEARESR